MPILLITFLAVLILAPKKRKRRSHAQPTAATFISPAELSRIEKEREKAARDAERERIRAEREQAAREQAKKDIGFYNSRLETLYNLETETARAYYRAAEIVEHDALQNKYSAVIGEAVTQKHITERDKLQKQLLQYQMQIHGAETKLTKAKNILKDMEV